MSQKANPAVIGGFVLGALVLFAGGLIVFGSGAILRDRIELVTFFPGSVQGLNTGAQVQFQGVPIGQVTSINLDYLPRINSFRIPVHYEIWPQHVDVLGGIPQEDAQTVIRGLVEDKGLRARLQSVSLVTGQYVVALSLNPRLEPAAQQPDHKGAIRVPALEATRDRIEDLLANLPLNDLVEQATGTLTAIHQLFSSGSLNRAIDNLNDTLLESRTLLATLNQQLDPLVTDAKRVMAEYRVLAADARERIDAVAPVVEEAAGKAAQLTATLDRELGTLAGSAEKTLLQSNRTLATIDRLIAADSPTRYQLDDMLRETTEAARAIRELADYLERHPEALLRGKAHH